MNTTKERILAPHTFSQDETIDLAKRLAQTNQRLEALEDQKKSVTSDFKARIDKEGAEASLLSMKIAQGYEMRETDAVVTFFPKDGKKTYSRADNGQFIREEQMGQADYQLEIKMAAEAPEQVEEKPEPAKEPKLTQHPYDTEVDADTKAALFNWNVKSEGFITALEQANLGTLLAVKTDLLESKMGGKRRWLILEKIKALEAANSRPNASEAGYVWDDDGLCQNPTNLVVVGPKVVQFTISAAQDDHGSWRRGYAIQDIEPDADMLCDRLNGIAFTTPEEAFACALTDVEVHFEKGKDHGVREYAATLRIISGRATRDKILLTACDNLGAGKSTTLDLASK